MNVLWCPITLLFFISHIFTVFPITVPSDTGVVSISTTAFKKRVAYPLSFDSQISAVRFSTELTLEHSLIKKVVLKF
jgi:hypothetical protein